MIFHDDSLLHGGSIVKQDNFHMETCHLDPKEDNLLAQKQGCIFEKYKYVDLALFCNTKTFKLGG